MKLKSILLVIVLALTTISYAQPPQGRQRNPEEMNKRQTEQMVKDLSLNEAQTTKVTALNEKYSKKTTDAFENAGEDRTARRELMQKMREEKELELKTILTADQFKKYQEIEQKRIEERQQRRDARPGGEGAERRGQQRGNGN